MVYGIRVLLGLVGRYDGPSGLWYVNDSDYHNLLDADCQCSTPPCLRSASAIHRSLLWVDRNDAVLCPEGRSPHQDAATLRLD